MDDDEPEKMYPLSPAKMSKAPSWVMLGFLLGMAAVWGYRRSEVKPPVPGVTLTEWPRAARVEPSPLTTIETLFNEWSKHAVWSGDVTEVAMWRSETRGFTEFYEVRRVGEELYFRSMPKLTRPIIRHGVPLPAEVPLQFTETQEQYREWLEHGRFERQKEPTVQPTLFGPALVPAGEGVPRVRAPQPTPGTPTVPAVEKRTFELPPTSPPRS